MIKKIGLKRIISILVLLLAVLTLVSCKKTSIASIDNTAVYATTADNKYSITNGELWEEMKWSANDVISEKINDVILADVKEEINEALKFFNGETTITEEKTLRRYKLYFDYFDLSAFTAIYQTADLEATLELNEKEYTKSINQYVDTIYIEEGKKVDSSKLLPSYIEDNAKVLFAGKTYETTYYMHEVYNDFVDVVSQKLLSFYYLEDHIENYNKGITDKEEFYYPESEIIQHYKENYKFAADRKAIIIRFLNEDEVNSTLKTFGIKVYDEMFYFIPQGTKTASEYSEYYDEFEIESATNSSKCFNLAAIGGDSLVFELYIQMYNYIYTQREALVGTITTTNDTNNRRDITEQLVSSYILNTDYSSPEDLILNWNENILESITYTQEELNDIDPDFKFYVSEKLQVNPEDDEARYSISGNSYNNFYYMVFKISEEELDESMVLTKEEDNEEIILEDKEDYKNIIVEEMMWAEITDTYISTVLDEKIKACKLYIYDEDIEILYSSVATSYSKTHKNAPASNVLFTVKYAGKTQNVTINEVFEELEVQHGTSIAIDLLSRKAIKETEAYKKTNEDRAKYKQTIELLLAYFANGQLEGYEPTLGKYNFLKLYFHSTDINYIIDNSYRLNAASNKLLTDYKTNDKFYELVTKYAEKAYNKGFDITASNLLVYVDFDEDGTPDKNFDWTKTVYNSTESYQEVACELINYIYSRMKNSGEAQATTMTSIVEEYNSCQRFTNGIDEYLGPGLTTEFDPTEPETIWAKYRRAGLYIEINEYTNITNTTSEATSGEGTCSLEIKTRLNEIYNDIYLFDTMPTEYVDINDYENANGWQIEEGFGLLVVTAAVTKASAKFEENDDINGVFKNLTFMLDEETIVISDIYNDSNIVNINQIKAFVCEYINYETSTIFPEDVQTFITNYVLPIYEKYIDSSTQRELLLVNVLTAGIKFTNAQNDTRFVEIREINKKISDEYLSDTDMANNYVGWWEDILTIGGNK